jgi:hypothetical protein
MLGTIPIYLWTDQINSGTDYTVRAVCSRDLSSSLAYTSFYPPSLSLYGGLAAWTNTGSIDIHSLDVAGTGGTVITGNALVYYTADLPAYATCEGSMIYDQAAHALKYAGASAWEAVTGITP